MAESPEYEEKVYLLGFMPVGEVNSLVLGELGESFDLDRMKKLWLPKSEKANSLMSSDMQLLDEEKMKDVIREIDPQYAKKLEPIEAKLQTNPFWKANRHSVKLVKIDELITLQNSVNIDRARELTKTITKDASMDNLLDFTLGVERKTVDKINHHQISNTAILFSTANHDVRAANVEVRKIPKFSDTSGPVHDLIPAVVIPIIEGDQSLFCIRTYSFVQMQDGTVKKIYFLTLQNGIHRAYALREMGFQYIPCLIIDPVTSEETKLLMSNWSPERLAQNGSQRPPLMKDYFNPDLTEKLRVRRTILCVRVEWDIERFTT